MWSRYLRVKKRNGIVAVFHELHPEPMYCSSEQWKSLIGGINGGTETLIGDLKKRKLVIESTKEDDVEFERIASELECRLNQPTILYLMTAGGCNLGCGYCPIPETPKKQGESLLSKENAIAGIDLWQEHLKEVYNSDLQYFVIFYGGEPLLNKETIKTSLAYLKMKTQRCDIPSGINLMITTNGILADDELIAMCKDYGIMVAIGLDGPKETNDMLRTDTDGRGTFERTIESIKQFVRNGIRTFASVTITPFNIDRLPEFSSFFRGLGIEKFGFNFLKGHGLMKLVEKDGLKNYYKKASRGIIENAKNQGDTYFEYQMEKKQKAFDSGVFYPADCTCYGNQIVIQPDGQVSNCPFYKANLGHVSSIAGNFRIWNQEIVKEWRKRLPIYHTGAAKALSGGGCAWSSIEIKDDLFAVDESSKIFSEEVLNELIWSKYDRLCRRKT